MLINPKKLLRRERQLKAVIGMGGKEFKILHEQFGEIYNKIQQKKLRKRSIGDCLKMHRITMLPRN